MRTFFAFPTWICFRVSRRWLPTSHPWHGYKFPLHDWALRSTPVARQLGALLWIQLFFIPIMLYLVLKGR